MGDDTALDRPASVDVPTTEVLAKAFAQGCLDLNIPLVQVIFHGGEPMMINPELFAQICETLQNHISPVANLQLFIQTNGIVFNEKWIQIFKQYEVCVGFSIDGDREAHDRYRLNKMGRSTFDLTEKNLKCMIDRSRKGECPMPTTISVIDPSNNYKNIYSYLRSLGIEGMSFLLPDRNVDNGKELEPEMIEAYGRALYEIFEAWFFEDNTKVQITHINRMLEYFQIYETSEAKGYEYLYLNRNSNKRRTQIIIARTDGTLAVNDTYIPALSWYKTMPIYSMKESSLKDFLEDYIFEDIEEIKNTLPRGCANCKWRKICKGGDIENRYSEKSGFDNPSIYCDAYKLYFNKVCKLLVDSGYPAEMIPTADNSYPAEMGATV